MTDNILTTQQLITTALAEHSPKYDSPSGIGYYCAAEDKGQCRGYEGNTLYAHAKHQAEMIEPFIDQYAHARVTHYAEREPARLLITSDDPSWQGTLRLAQREAWTEGAHAAIGENAAIMFGHPTLPDNPHS